MAQGKPKQTPKRRLKRPGKKESHRQSFFRREAHWMTWMTIAPFGIGVVIALVFWFTR